MRKKRRSAAGLPVARTLESGAGERKLSEIMKELSQRLLKRPERTPSLAAAQTALTLASAAWNLALGDTGLRDEHRRNIEQLERAGGRPWGELLSTDTDRLIEELAEYKRAHYPADYRRIATARMIDEGGEEARIRVEWVDWARLAAAVAGSATSSAAPAGVESGRPIAAKLVAKMKRAAHGKVVNIRNVIAGRAAAEELQKRVAAKEVLADYHPAHAAYIYTQNQMSVMLEQLSALEEMAPMVDIISKAQDLYSPGGPPISPLTISYYTCWALFDACAGPARETIGTTVLEIGGAFGMHSELLRVIRLMQDSRMGLYVYQGNEGGLVLLKELCTGNVLRALSPTGYPGKRGELWYARVLPPPLPGGTEHVVFTTPYIVLQPGLREWEAYFRRNLPTAPERTRLDAYERHMKYGPTGAYWNDYVFEAYVNYRTEAVYLAGLPDIPESRPHSEVNGWGSWFQKAFDRSR